MSAVEAQIQFAAEFALLLVSVAGLVLVLTRPDLIVREPAERAMFGLACGAWALSAFLIGAQIVDDPQSSGLVALRLAGVVVAIRVSLEWRGSPRSKALLMAALAAFVVGAGVGAASETAAEGARLLAALLLGSSLVLVSSRSIAARIAAGSAAVVLLVVLAVAVGQSAVLADTTEDEAIRRAEAQAGAQADLLEDQSRVALGSVGSLARVLGSNGSSSGHAAVQTLAESEVTSPAGEAAAQTLQALLAGLDEAFPTRSPGPFAYVTADGILVAGLDTEGEAFRQQIAGSRLVSAAIVDRREIASVVTAGDRLIALAGSPITVVVDGVEQVAGAAIAGVDLSSTYLEAANRAATDTSLTLAGLDGALASAGSQPPPAVLRDLSGQVVESGQQATSRDGGRFSVAVPVEDAGGVTVAAMVVSVPFSTIEATRNQLFQTLFVLALVSSLVALAVAAALGNRIGLGIRRLSEAAELMGGGDLDARAAVQTEDELGALGSTFNAMAGSISTMTGDLREAAAEEQRLRNRVEAVIAGMGEALIAIDVDGNITDLNGAAQQILATGAESALGSPLTSLVKAVDDSGSDVSTRLGTVTGDGWTLNAEIEPVNPRRRSDQVDAVPVAITAGALRDAEGNLSGAVLVMRDMRREREIEAMKTNFIANVGHELRTPLTPIKGYSGMLATRDVPGDMVKQFASEIRAGSEQLERVIGQLVNFATIAAGRLEVRPVEIPVDDYFARALDRWTDKSEPDHPLSVAIGPATPALMADLKYLDQSIDELIDNAIKYSPAGGAITLAASPASEGRVAITISDHGVGIEPGQMKDLFSEFSQGDASATRQFGGLGLGLSLVRHILSAHDGAELDVKSQPDRGTTVTMLVPAGDGPTDTSSTTVTAPTEAPPEVPSNKPRRRLAAGSPRRVSGARPLRRVKVGRRRER